MKVTAIICSLLTAGSLIATAGGKKSPQQSALMSFSRVLEHYKKSNNNTYPSSWEEFEQKVDPGLAPIIDLAVETVDLKNRYVFLSGSYDFVPRGRPERFVMMAVDGKLEGSYNAGHGLTKDGRFVFVEMKDGSVSLRKYGEIDLQAWFKAKEFDLYDVVAKSKIQSQQRSISTKPTKKTVRTPRRAEDPTEQSGASSGVSHRGIIASNHGSSKLSPPWWGYGISGLFVLAGIAAVVKMKAKAPKAENAQSQDLDISP